MKRRNPTLNWDRLLDGSTYELNLVDIDWETSLNDLRAKAHYEADKRRGVAVTHKVDSLTLEVRGSGVKSKPALPCSCGAQVWEQHVITCTSLGRNAATAIGGPRPAQQAPQRPAPTHQEQPPTMAVQQPAEELSAEDEEALLGPCTCGKSPYCLPSCARFA